MARLDLQNVPEQLYRKLEESAARHGQALDQEAIRCLELALERRRRDPKEVLRRMEEFRASLHPLFLTDEDIRQAREEGRA